jgi:hypothetical protein
MPSNNTNSSVNNIVRNSLEDELLLHGIRIKGKSVVVELSNLENDLQSDQLHVGLLNDVDNMQLLSDISSADRKEFGAKMWKSLAQALKYFVLENTCTVGLIPSTIYVNQDFTKIYLTKWVKSDATQIESAGSIEQVYIKQLTHLYVYLSTGKDLNDTVQNLENKNWDKIHLKQELEVMNVDANLKAVFAKGLQLDGNMYISIDALLAGVTPHFFIPEPKGLVPFVASMWIAFTTQTTLAIAALISVYAHTLK